MAYSEEDIGYYKNTSAGVHHKKLITILVNRVKKW